MVVTSDLIPVLGEDMAATLCLESGYTATVLSNSGTGAEACAFLTQVLRGCVASAQGLEGYFQNLDPICKNSKSSQNAWGGSEKHLYQRLG